MRAVDSNDNRQVIATLLSKGKKEIKEKRKEALQEVTQMLGFLRLEDSKYFLHIHKKIITKYVPDC